MKKFAITAILALALTFTLGCPNTGSDDNGSSSSVASPSSTPSSSSSVPSYSSSVPTQTGVIHGTPVTYGDETYQTVVIDNQTWMARNLNYYVEGSKCYNNDPANCATYGRLYDWTTAMNIDKSYNDALFIAPAKHQGICPDGWHIPSKAEWAALINFVGDWDQKIAGIKLKAANGWKSISGSDVYAGTDDYGFAALPGGHGAIGYLGDDFSSVSTGGRWWSATEFLAKYAWFYLMNYLDKGVLDENWAKGTYLFSVRCLKN